MSVLSVVKVRIEAKKTAAILAEAADTLRTESTTQPGFLAGEVLVSQDKKTVVIITEWADLHMWSRSRYDVRIGKMLEDCLAASSQIEFEIYDRHTRFSAEKT
jgi:heme-degrading monooxygenase HmoA